MKKIVVDAELSQLNTVNEFLEAFLEENDCDPKIMFQLGIVLEELFVNVVSYAYEGKDGKVEVNLEYAEGDGKMTFSIIDSGVPFDPLAKEDVDIDEKAMDESIGGLGIFMSKQMVDDIRYQRQDDKNILTFEKVIHS